MALKELAVCRVHSIGVRHLAQIDGTKNNIREIHVGFLQSIQKIAHGLSQLQLKVGRDYSLIWNEAIFSREIQRVAIKNAGAGGGAGGHISRPDRFAFVEVCSGYTTKYNVIPFRKTDNLDGPAARCIAEFKITRVNLAHDIVLPTDAHVGIHP